jgi:hypothetical protein
MIHMYPKAPKHISINLGTGGLCYRANLISVRIALVPVPVASRSKTYVCGRSPDEIVGSNPTGGMDVCLLCVLCVQVEACATS